MVSMLIITKIPHLTTASIQQPNAIALIFFRAFCEATFRECQLVFNKDNLYRTGIKSLFLLWVVM